MRGLWVFVVCVEAVGVGRGRVALGWKSSVIRALAGFGVVRWAVDFVTLLGRGLSPLLRVWCRHCFSLRLYQLVGMLEATGDHVRLS